MTSYFKQFFEKFSANSWAKIVVVLFTTVLVYLNIFQNQFLMEDFDLSSRWPVLDGPGDIFAFFTGQGQEGVYLPLKMLFHAVHYHFWGLDPFGYHFVALVFHLLAVVLVYRIGMILTRNVNAAVLGSLLFGLHPVHVESVTSLITSTNLPGLVFTFAAFLFYLESAPHGARKGFYAASLVCALLAVFSSQIAVALPLLILFYEACFRGFQVNEWRSPQSLKTIRAVIPYFLFAVVYLLARLIVPGGFASEGYLEGSFYLTMLVMIKAFARYILLLFWPIDLSTNHILSEGIFSHTPSDFQQQAVMLQSFLDADVILSLFLVITILLLAVRYAKQKPLVLFCVGWFFISLLPVSNIIPSPVYFGERYLYIASFGFCLLLAVGLCRVYENSEGDLKKWYPWAGALVVIGLLIFFSSRTAMRNADWKNDLSFYKTEARANPQSSLAQANLGVMYLQFGLYEDAIESLRRAIAINPADPNNYFSVAEIYTQYGRHAEALKFLQEAVRLDPDFAEAYVNISVTYQSMGMTEKAKESLEKAVLLYQNQGREDEAGSLREAFDAYWEELQQED